MFNTHVRETRRKRERERVGKRERARERERRVGSEHRFCLVGSLSWQDYEQRSFLDERLERVRTSSWMCECVALARHVYARGARLYERSLTGI